MTFSDSFLRAVNVTLEWEGGYGNDPRDPGGETNFGIDKRSHPHEDIKHLTRERAIEIYHESYWVPSRAEEMPTAVGGKVFDLSVNTGLKRGAILLQKALGVTADGKVGPKTLAALHAAEPEALHLAIRREAEKFYRSLAGFSTFGRGWLRRNNAV